MNTAPVLTAQMLDVNSLIGTLATSRPAFHSEGDFQHAFAWELHLRFPKGHVRLERPIETKLGSLHIDVTAEFDGCVYAFELKYKTKTMAALVGSELYELQNHGGQPQGRYDFLKDIARLESINQSLPKSVACAILLTNDSAYWSKPRSTDDTSAAFSLYEGRSLSGRLDWSPRAGTGTKRGREEPINLGGQYLLEWRDYSEIHGNYYSRFRYLTVETATGPAVREAATSGSHGG